MCFNKFVGGRLGGQQPVAWLLSPPPPMCGACVWRRMCAVVGKHTRGLMQV